MKNVLSATIGVLNQGFKFQKSVSSDCHNFLMMCTSKSDVAIITVKSDNYCCIIFYINKSDAINLLENVVLDDLEYI